MKVAQPWNITLWCLGRPFLSWKHLILVLLVWRALTVLICVFSSMEVVKMNRLLSSRDYFMQFKITFTCLPSNTVFKELLSRLSRLFTVMSIVQQSFHNCKVIVLIVPRGLPLALSLKHSVQFVSMPSSRFPPHRLEFKIILVWIMSKKFIIKKIRSVLYKVPLNS